MKEKSSRMTFVFFLTLAPILLSGRIKSLGVSSFFGIDLTLLALLTLFTGVALMGFAKKFQFDFSWFGVISPLALVYLLSYFSLPNKDSAYEKTTLLFLVCLPCFILVYFLTSTNNGLKNYALVWYVSGTVVAILTLLTGGSLSSEKRFGLGNETLSSAYIVSCSCILSFLLLNSTKSWKRILVLLVFAINLVALIFNASRGPFVATIVCLLISAILYFTNLIKKILFTVASALLFFLVLSYAPNESRLRLGNVFEDFTRRELLQSSFQNWSNSPFLGLGVDQFKFIFPVQRYPHNIFAEVLFETGILGLFALLIVIGIAFRKNTPQMESAYFQPVFFIGLVNLISHFFSNDITNRYLWISLAPLVMLNRIRRKSKE